MIRMIEKMRISPPILLPREVRFRGGVATTTLRACGTATYTRTKSPPTHGVYGGRDARSPRDRQQLGLVAPAAQNSDILHMR